MDKGKDQTCSSQIMTTMFDPTWIHHHPTTIYLNKMKSIPQIEIALKE